MVGRGGTKMEKVLCNPKPWKNKTCSNMECKACQFQPGSCTRVKLTYEIMCGTCKEMDRRTVYVG